MARLFSTNHSAEQRETKAALIEKCSNERIKGDRQSTSRFSKVLSVSLGQRKR